MVDVYSKYNIADGKTRMNLDFVGKETKERIFIYSWKNVVLYNLGISFFSTLFMKNSIFDKLLTFLH